jgi:hypothetical protein
VNEEIAMAMEIVRSGDQIEEAWARAQRASFAASDAGDTDDYAEAMYGLLQWLTGNRDDDPTLELDDDE